MAFNLLFLDGRQQGNAVHVQRQTLAWNATLGTRSDTWSDSGNVSKGPSEPALCSGEAGMVHISKWDPSEGADVLPISYGNESVDKRLNFSDAFLSPWWNEHSNRSHLQRQLGTLRNAQEKETGQSLPLISSEDPSLLPEDQNNDYHQLNGCRSTKLLPMFLGCTSLPSKSQEPHFTGGKAS